MNCVPMSAVFERLRTPYWLMQLPPAGPKDTLYL